MTGATGTSPQTSRHWLKPTRSIRAWPLMAPAVGLLLIWAIVPLALTLWYSFQNYNLLSPPPTFAGLENYYFLLTDPDLFQIVWNTLALVLVPLAVTVTAGVLLAVLYHGPFFGRGIARPLVIAPFFVMPTVSALIWKNLLMHPVYGLFAWLAKTIGMQPVDWFTNYPMTAIIIIISWQWIPFATLILLTAMQSLDREQMEAARMDGAGAIASFIFVILPHLGRPIAVVIMLETIFFLAIYAEILVTTVGGPGVNTTNIPFYIYSRALLGYDVGIASAGGIFAIVVANIVAFFFVRAIARQL